MKKFLTGFLTIVVALTTMTTNPSKIYADNTAEWESISASNGSVKEVIKDGVRYYELSSSDRNDNQDNPAIFKPNKEWKTDGKEANFTFDFIAENTSEKSRFGVHLFYTDSKNFLTVAYDAGGWFWEYKVDGNGTYKNDNRLPGPKLGSKNTLEVSLKDDLLIAWITSDDGDKKQLFTQSFDTNVINQLQEKSEDIVVKLGTYSGILSKILVKADNQDDIVIPEPEFERPVLDTYEEYTFETNFEDLTDESLKEMFTVEKGKVETSIITHDGNNSVRLDFQSRDKNLIIFRETPLLENYIFEADITIEKAEDAINDMIRFGQLVRVQDGGEYGYAVIGDNQGDYFTENFGAKPAWSPTSKGTVLNPNEVHHWKTVVEDQTITLFIDGQQILSNTMDGLAKGIGAFGFFKDRGMGSVLVDNVKVTKITPERPVDPDNEGVVPVEIKSSDMTVRLDEAFPRVLDYTLTNGKKMQGQPTKIDTIKINNVDIVPEVSLEKVSENSIKYILKAINTENKINADLTILLEVKNNTLEFSVTEIKNNNTSQKTNEEIIRTLEIPNHSLVSVNSSETNANVYGAKISTDTTVNGDTLTEVTDTLRSFNSNYMYAVISNSELSASMHSNSQYSSGGGVNDFVRINARVKEFESYNSVGLSSSPWIYHRDVMFNEQTLELPEAKVVITEDANDDGVVNWQDGAIAFRDIMYSPVGAESVKDLVAYRIAMNFGSHAQNPFLMTLDGIKKINLHTDGLGQSVLLKGYGSEGHDSGHLNYADIGRRMGGVEEFKYLIDESVDFGAKIGIHVNASETYPESKYFNEKILRKSADGSYNYGWNWIDQGINIDAAIDLANGRRSRFEDLKNLVGDNLDWIYVDVWGNGQSGDNNAWTSHQLAKEIHDQGWRLGGEWGYAFEPDSTFQHWAADLTYGGYTLKGINSTLTRFIFNQQRDSWPADFPSYGGAAEYPLLGGYNMKDFEGWQGRNDYNGYIVNLFENNLSTKYIQHFKVNRWVEGTPVNMTNSKGKNFDWNPEMMVELVNDANDKLIIERKSNDYKNDRDNYRSRTIKLNDRLILDGDKYLLPWNWDENGNNLTGDQEKLYHFNKKGGTSTWEIPSDWNVSSVKFYQLTETGNKLIDTITVKDGRITLDAKADIPYVIYKGDQAEKNVSYGSGAHIVDPGFNYQNLDAWDVTGENADVIKSQASNDMLRIQDNSETTKVSQILTDLEAGDTYVVYVGVDNRSDSKAILELNVDGEIISNYTEKSIAKNYVKAYAHNTNSSTVNNNSYFQNMFVYFTAPTNGKNVTLSLIREAGDGAIYFDDVRITKNNGNPHLKENVFYQDFENSTQGIYPFVVGNVEGVEDNRTHLSEKHEPYTQRGWNNKKISDVIDGDWSLKTNGLTQRRKLVYQTIPQNIRFEIGETYKVSFDYEAGSEGTYAVMIGDGEFTGNEQQIPLTATLNKDGAQRFEVEITGSKSGQTWFGIYSTSVAPDLQDSSNKEANFRSYKDVVLDNVRIEKVVPPYEVTLENKEFNISMTGLSNVIENTDILNVTKDETLKKEFEEKMIDVDIYNMSLVRNGIEVKPLNGEVTVTIPTRSTRQFIFMKASQPVTELLHLQSDGTWTPVNAKYVDDALVFKTHELGTYALNYGEKIIPVDKTHLKTLIEQASELKPELYTELSWKEFETVLISAKELYKNEEATQLSIDEMVRTLAKAMSHLELTSEEDVNYDALQALVGTSKTLKKDEYTEESWTKFESILKNAITMLENQDADSQHVIDAIGIELNDAIRALEKTKSIDSIKPIDPVDPNNPSQTKDSSDSKLPGTGVESPMSIIVLGISAVVIGTLFFILNKRKRQPN